LKAKIKLNILFKRLDIILELPKGTSKSEVKKFLNIEQTRNLDFEETIYVLRFVDNILLELGYDEAEEM
jgi:hypothetical protein